MKTKAIISIGVLFIVIVGSFSLFNGNDLSEVGSNGIRIISVDAVMKNPSKYEGNIGVKGIVSGTTKKLSIFSLGCEDACAGIPVKYAGEFPEVNNEIIAYGEITKENGRFLFKATSIENQ